MSKLDDYRQKLKELNDWTPFLLKNSGLPGPRGNLELAQAVAESASKSQIEEFLSIPLDEAPENTPKVFLVFCGAAALGKQIVRGEHQLFTRLRTYASDPRWRVREATAIALQYVGDDDMKLLLKETQIWCKGNWHEQRAAAAALAEPRLLQEPKVVSKVLQIFDKITAKVESAQSPGDEAFKVLRQSMGYCWSVAVAASPKDGKPFIEKWLKSQNPNVRWIMRENLKKKRLSKMDTKWVEASQAELEKATK